MFVNRFNEEWVRAARRLSPGMLLDLPGAVGPPPFAYFGSLDLAAPGGPVSWEGPEPAPVWLDVTREYTARRVRQWQIRDAVGKPGSRSAASWRRSRPPSHPRCRSRCAASMHSLGRPFSSTCAGSPAATGRFGGKGGAGSCMPACPQHPMAGSA